jgi:gas vesicle protein
VPVEAEKFEDLGFVKYSGASLVNGVIDAGSAGSALVGLDEAVRFFNSQQSKDFADLQYDIPVQTRAGSWEAVLVAGAAVGGVFALGYAKKAGEKLAENDFKEIGVKHALKKSMSALQTLAKLVKHTGRSRGWDRVRVEPTLEQETVLVANDKGEELSVPLEYFRWYQQVPPRLLVKMTSVVRADRVLTIGVVKEAGTDEVTVFEAEKPLFDQVLEDEYDEDILFPELTHGANARLEGRLIRGSEASNSVGLEYMGHVINCVPAHGSVRQYKAALFLRCKVEGRITRHAKNRFVADRRPTLIVERVVPLEADGQLGMFAG